MKRPVKITLFLLIAAACAAAGIWAALRPLPVTSEILAAGTLAESFTVQGTLIPTESRVLNAGAAGDVAGLPFQVGMPVTAGETVVAVAAASQTETELRLAQSRQQLAAARQEYASQYGDNGAAAAGLPLAESERDAAAGEYQAAAGLNEAIPGTYTTAEMNRLRGRLTAAEQNLTLARNASSGATKAYYQEQIASWESQIAALEATLGIEPVTAPFDGVLWEVYVETGSYVAQYQPVAKIYRAGEMRVEVWALAEDVAGMRLGDEVECALAGGAAFTARISYISPVAATSLSAVGVEESRSLVELSPEALPAAAGAGHRIDARFTVGAAADVIAAPIAAIVPLPDGGDGLYVIRGGKAVLTPVTTGRQSGGRVELLAGAAAGDEIIPRPFDSEVRDGRRVTAG
ncbi:MAG: HlyD family efflux transporter periplasmic adaptor subunit [Peptococcaceae bacterium]|jgi:multidrug efflux pump subunit AcrA (membrane-fusion protein)|nr:HlyD family efflux transporter periplasmic adaptor subunit [Peptococcaceae bacterium]